MAVAYYICMGASASSARSIIVEDMLTGETQIYDQFHARNTAAEAQRCAGRCQLIRSAGRVAPIIIRNCQEEFQHFLTFKEPIVYGRIANSLPEHPLVRNKYILVKDVSDHFDKLNSMATYDTPNVRSNAAGYSVYAMGQPSLQGINNILCKLTQDNMEIIELGSLRDDGCFFFYTDLKNLTCKPQMLCVSHEDFITSSEEVYSRLTFYNPLIRYGRLCFPPEGAPSEADFDSILKLYKVDTMINMCGRLHHLIDKLNDARETLENVTEDYTVDGESARLRFHNRCKRYLERYFYLICFNAYLHDQYGFRFHTSFSQWMRDNPMLYRLLGQLDISERTTKPSLLLDNTRYLVADDHVGLDVLSTKLDVSVSNFRDIKKIPVYGMAQPNKEGLKLVIQRLTSSPKKHPVVLVVNVRDDLAIQCGENTYCWREEAFLDVPISMDGVSDTEIEEKERALKKEIVENNGLQVYEDITQPRRLLQFDTVLTPREMAEDIMRKASEKVLYHRVPLPGDRGLSEKEFDILLSMIYQVEEFCPNGEEPAILFYCRTGKARTTTAMVVASLIHGHLKGFPTGTNPGEQERVSVPNAAFTMGNFKIVSKLIRILPNGPQIKREVDFVLDQCSETMTPMYYHLRELIFSTYNKTRAAKTPSEAVSLKRLSLDYLERYVYLIIFNAYLHAEKASEWKYTFSAWMQEVGPRTGLYNILDSLGFPEFEPPSRFSTMRGRWTFRDNNLPFRGEFK
ncbi:paladin [Lingula anatina]|uniref:Paladin n=1 Tax=Lingula anatina TaxID=7574 RepID=A0A1S3IHI6_LINAN|nr:paladin [Lingula anatina]|eukprot:XP_013397677.1 paladin [Lingula anatina]